MFGREDVGAPLQAHQARAAVGQGVGRIAAHPAGQQLDAGQPLTAVAFQPRNRPLLAAGNASEGRIDFDRAKCRG